jgi:hypothetical protein
MAEKIAYRFLEQLTAADKELSPEQVGELEAHALLGIPELP